MYEMDTDVLYMGTPLQSIDPIWVYKYKQILIYTWLFSFKITLKINL